MIQYVLFDVTGFLFQLGGYGFVEAVSALGTEDGRGTILRASLSHACALLSVV